MRYVGARLESEYRAEAYRIYVTDSLQGIPQNKYNTQRYINLVSPKPVKKGDGDKIALDVIKRAGLKFK